MSRGFAYVCKFISIITDARENLKKNFFFFSIKKKNRKKLKEFLGIPSRGKTRLN